MKKVNQSIKLVKTNVIFISVLILTALTSHAADNTQIYLALNQVRQAQSALYSAENALVNSLQNQNSFRTCRIKTTYIDYTGDGSNEALAISNARANCKKNGTQANVCDNASVDICWEKN